MKHAVTRISIGLALFAICILAPTLSSDATATGTLSAQYATSGQPTVLTAGGTAIYTVTITNTGTSTWPAGGTTPVRLGIHFAHLGGGYPISGSGSSWLTNQKVFLPSGVAPGQSTTLRVYVQTPNTVGAFILEYQLLQVASTGSNWFPQYLDSAVSTVAVSPTVSAASAAQFYLQTQPSNFAPGAIPTYTLTVKNTGTTTWSAGGTTPVSLAIHFASRGGGYGVSGTTSSWAAGGQFPLPGDVAPGASTTVSVSVPAPSVSGSYTLEYQLVKQGVGWFLQYMDNPVTVATMATSTPTVALGAFINDPANNMVFTGVDPTSSDATALDRYAQFVGRMPAIVMWYQDWDAGPALSQFPTQMVSGVVARGAMPMITWMPGGSSDVSSYTCKAITAGTYDSYITSWALAAKSWGHPFFLRFAHEMNGNWYPWGTGPTNPNANTASDFIAMWRHVHAIFASVGATNARWVWSPNIDGSPPTNQLAQDYPGDAYVDWVALDGYNRGAINNVPWRAWPQIFSVDYSTITALTAKPLMVAETASIESQGSKSGWITQSFLSDIPSQYPKIRAITWFDENKEADWRVNSSSSSLSAYQQVVATPYYQAQIP